MNFVMRKSESKIADPYYHMDLPMGALVVAPEAFFARFGKTFSTPTREELQNDLDRNMVFHAVPSDAKRHGISAYVVRQIHNSKIKDALAGKLVDATLNPRNHIDELLKESVGDIPLAGAQKAAAPVNVHSMTLAQLVSYAQELKIAPVAGKKRTPLTREELTKKISEVLAKQEAGR